MRKNDMCSSNTCDKYMCRLRHINDPVLSSLKMEGIRSFLGVLGTKDCIYIARSMSKFEFFKALKVSIQLKL
jgi:hypothetical protein